MFKTCICGSTDYKTTIRKGFVTSETGQSLSKEITVGECSNCGLIRQVDLPFQNEEEYSRYYEIDYPPIGQSYTIKNYNKDLAVAEKRFDTYRAYLKRSENLLDVGSGSGAFVDVCRNAGIAAFGCDIGDYHYTKTTEFTYQKKLEDVYFPTDHFNAITCHDVVEHLLTPVSFLKEIFRIMKQEGIGFIEIPDFFHSEGERHWKYAEHIWFFTIDQFKSVLSEVGFVVEDVYLPIPGKVMFKVKKPIQKRPSILFPPGIGDVYWELVKLQAFLKKKGLGLPDAYVACRKSNAYNAHNRAFPLLEMVPFVHSSGEIRSIEGPNYRAVWEEAYRRAGKTVFENIEGCDYFISHNGHMGRGVTLEKSDPGLACNWDLPLFISLEQEKFRKESIENYGKYVVFHFVFQGTYKYWIHEFPVADIIKSINSLAEQTGYTPILAGAPWDAAHRVLKRVKENTNCIDLLGKTSLEQVFGLIRGSELVVGFPSGLTIMSAVLRQKTLIIWNDYYNKDFMKNSCPPYTWNKTYFVENTKGLTVERLVAHSQLIMKDETSIALPKVKNLPAQNESRTVLCVLKSGGDFTLDYVVRLKNAIERNTTTPHEFICLTDITIDPKICKSIKLTQDLKGWWSKIELFRPGLTKAGYIVYFDLDTIIAGNIDDLFSINNYFSALRPWNRKNRALKMLASGIMIWRNNNTLSFIFDQFKKEQAVEFSRGDQEYITGTLKGNGVEFDFLQDSFAGIYSYKRIRRLGLGIPGDARIVCFHGTPRPHEVRLRWVNEHWK